MFQKQTFGSNTTGFGAFNTAASTSSPFGSFKPATAGSTFGAAPAFGASTSAQPATGGGLFGSSNTSTGLFGSTPAAAPAPAFGASNSFSFGQNTSGGLFNANTPASGGLFGNNSFAKPAGFGFGSTTTTGTTGGGLFGSTPSTSTGLFGQQTNTLGGGGLFSTGSTFGQQSATGTAHAKYNPVVGTDVVVKSGNSQTINIKHHCITCMKEYESKSLEELRLEDYTAGRKGSSGGMFGGFQQPTENKPLFGGSTFGQPATTSAPSLFGGGLGTSGGFGQTSECTINIYNYAPQHKPKPQYGLSGLLFGSAQTDRTGQTEETGQNDLLDAAKRAIDSRNRHEDDGQGRETERTYSDERDVECGEELNGSEGDTDLDYTCPLYSVSNSNKNTPVFKFSTDSNPHEKWKTAVFFSKEPLWPVNRNKTKTPVNNNKYVLYGRTGNVCGSVRRFNSEKNVPDELKAEFASSAAKNTHFKPIAHENTLNSKDYFVPQPQVHSVYYFNQVPNPQGYNVQQPTYTVTPTHTLIHPQQTQLPIDPQSFMPIHPMFQQPIIPLNTYQPMTYTLYPQFPIQPQTFNPNLTYYLPNEYVTQNQFTPVPNTMPPQSNTYINVQNPIPQSVPEDTKFTDDKKNIRINIHNNVPQGTDGNNNVPNLNAENVSHVTHDDSTINVYNYPKVESVKTEPLVLKNERITGREEFWNWTADNLPNFRAPNPMPFSPKRVTKKGVDKATNTEGDLESESSSGHTSPFGEPVVVSAESNSTQSVPSASQVTTVADSSPPTSIKSESDIEEPSTNTFESTFQHGANSAFKKPKVELSNVLEAPSQTNIFCSPPKFTVPPGAFFGPSQSVEPGFFKCKHTNIQCASCGCNLHTVVSKDGAQSGETGLPTCTAPDPSVAPGTSQGSGSGIFGPMPDPVPSTSQMASQPVFEFKSNPVFGPSAVKSSVFGPDTLDLQRAMSKCTLKPECVAGPSKFALNSHPITATVTPNVSTVDSRPRDSQLPTIPEVPASGSVTSQTSLDNAASDLRIHDVGIGNAPVCPNATSQASISNFMSILKLPMPELYAMARAKAMSRAQAQNTTTLTSSGVSNAIPSCSSAVSTSMCPISVRPSTSQAPQSISIIKLPIAGPSNIPTTEVRPNSHVVTNSISISKLPLTVDTSMSESSMSDTSSQPSPISVVEPASGVNVPVPPAKRHLPPSDSQSQSCSCSGSECSECGSDDSRTASPSPSDLENA